MTMNECTDQGALLHNMSTPSKSVVKYSGLKGLAPLKDPGQPAASKSAGIFGTPVRFALPVALMGRSASFILRSLGIDPIDDGKQQLISLNNTRASELPLPDGCAVIPAKTAHAILWNDTLSTLAILCKCSDRIWLRDKTPALSTGLEHTQVTLLVPPMFASRLPKAQL